jgi:DNA-directed RNA polymerase specialized sigma24 family protein|tara:strand:+ start:578 stop:1135 length:558 start_codon:yes stop_codon:yes gene_type:complete
MTRPTRSAPITSIDQIYREVAINVEKFAPPCPPQEIIYRLGGKTKEDLIQDIVLTLVDKDNNVNIPFSFDTLTAAYVRSRAFYYLVDASRRGANKTKTISLDDHEWDELSTYGDDTDSIFFQEVIETLSGRPRLLLSYHMLGYTHAEVSKILSGEGWSIAPDTVKVQVSKIKRQLRDNFEYEASL